MCNREEFERVFKSVFKGHRMTRGANGDYVSIVPWATWKVWQAARQAPASREVEPVAFRFGKDQKYIANHWPPENLKDKTVQPLYTNPPAKVPEVPTEEMLIEGVEALIRGLKAFPDNYTQIVNNIWEDMAAFLLTTPTPATTPQPADNWIKCSDRLPTEADADMYGKVWCFLPNRQEPRVTQFGFKEAAFFYNRDCTVTHWMTTGLKHPNPPAEGAE